MVVSIDISGALEEKLRRLVELGIYASVSEAVRDAVRKLLQEIDMRKIALQLYVKKGTTLYYAANLAETPLDSFIEYLITNEITPAIGVLPNEDIRIPAPGSKIIFDPLSLYIIYNTKLNDIMFNLASIYEFYYPQPLEPYWLLQVSKRGTNHSKAFIDMKPLKIKEKSANQNLYMTPIEYSLTKLTKEFIVISDDINYRKRVPTKTLPSITLLLSYINLYKITKYDLKEIIYSIKIIPYLIPLELEEILYRGVS